MSEKILVIFTSSYPYGYGETFLEAEIKILSRDFKKIIIVPESNSSEEVRHLPSNVETQKLQSKSISWFDLFTRKSLKRLVVKEFFC